MPDKMSAQLKMTTASRPLFLAGGIAAVLLAALLTWLDFTASLDFRQPVPSPDGRYFAYFDQTRGGAPGAPGRFDLIVSTAAGQELSRFVSPPGVISWSSAGNLAVIDDSQHQVAVFSNTENRYLLLTRLALLPGASPLWSADGAKLAYLEPQASGGGIAIYDLLQTQSAPVPLPKDFQLHLPILLFWPPVGSQLYFSNSENQTVALNRLDMESGRVQSLARGVSFGGTSHFSQLKMSLDGTKVYLPPPLDSVVDAQTGQTLWTLPQAARLIGLPWSADSHKIFFSRPNQPGLVFAHDFGTAKDQTLLAHAPSNGFFAGDERSYFYPSSRPPRQHFGFWHSIRAWLNPQWGWQRVGTATGVSQPLGRALLMPWEETQSGEILMSRDDYTRVRYGLYDPRSQTFAEFNFPTFWEDLLRQGRSQAIVLVSVVLYAWLAFFVYVKRSASPPARALYILSLTLMILFALVSLMNTSFRVDLPRSISSPSMEEWRALGWASSAPRLDFFNACFFLLVIALAAVPPSLLHFALVFPERNRFLIGRRALKPILYGAAFLPLIGIAWNSIDLSPSTSIPNPIRDLFLIAGLIVVATALFAFLHSYRHPPDRRAREQVRWVSAAFAVPPVGLAALLVLAGLVNWLGMRFGHRSNVFPGFVFVTTVLALFCLFPPTAIGYALLAHKLFDIQLLIRRSVRYSLMTFVVVAFYLLLVGGLSWALAGRFQSPSRSVVIFSTLVTALMVAPARSRLQGVIDRTFDRARYEFRETLEQFSRTLPSIFDRQTLEARMRESVVHAMTCRSFYLFVFDRGSRRLRIQSPLRGVAIRAKGIEFDPAEPLCQHLIKERSFEVEVSPYDSNLIPIFRSAAERLAQLEVVVVLGLERRGELVGMMALGPKASGEFYNSEDLELLEGVARQAAIAVENTELFEQVARDREIRKELEVASEVQAQFFPITVPKSAAWEIAGRCLPAHSVSGDYYDFLELQGGRIGLAIGDVSGKGVSAALLMANLQGLLRTQAPAAEGLDDLARQINHQLYGSSRGAKYCTFFYAVYNNLGRRLEYFNAGHNAPLLANGGATVFLESTGVPLGLFPEAAHEVHCEVLRPGARLILYSDGITEARDERGELYGVSRLLAVVSAAGEMAAPALMDKIFADVRDFSGDASIEDDQTIVVFQVAENSGKFEI